MTQFPVRGFCIVPQPSRRVDAHQTAAPTLATAAESRAERRDEIDPDQRRAAAAARLSRSQALPESDHQGIGGVLVTYAAVMTHVQPEAEAAPRLACAIDVARRFRAAIIGVGAEMTPAPAYGDGFYGVRSDWSAAMAGAVEERLEAARAAFCAATADMGERATFRCGVQFPEQAMAAESRAADLIVAGGAPRSLHGSYTCCAPAELAISTGRPVLVVPPAGPPLSAKTILLAWKDTREARRALSDALPFFELAERVVVVAVCNQIDADNARIEVDDVAAALRRRGINAEAKLVEHAHPDGFQILRQATQEGAGLIVCGAYGHSRLGELVFGGVTRDLLSQDDAYLLLSH